MRNNDFINRSSLQSAEDQDQMVSRAVMGSWRRIWASNAHKWDDEGASQWENTGTWQHTDNYDDYSG